MDSIGLELFVSTIGNFGFPLVLASYLLLRFEKKIESLTDAIHELSNKKKKTPEKEFFFSIDSPVPQHNFQRDKITIFLYDSHRSQRVFSA